jgi:cell division septation protein DedD
VAQIVGAIATVALGVLVLHRYTSGDARPPAPELGHETYARPAAPDSIPGQDSVHVIVLTPAMLGLRDAGERSWTIDRACTPARDAPASSAAHLDNGTFLSH